MPEYTYICNTCKHKFELFLSYSKYDPSPKCVACSSASTSRSYHDDLANASCCVKKHSSELKTLGDVANRNRDTMGDDQKAELYSKHNEYKEQQPNSPLPKGMSRIPKTKIKNKWTQK